MGLSNAERQRLYRARKATATPDKVAETKRVLVPKGVERPEAVSCDHSGLWKVLVELQARVEALEKPGKAPLAYQKPTVEELKAQMDKLALVPRKPAPFHAPDSWRGDGVAGSVSNDDPGDAA